MEHKQPKYNVTVSVYLALVLAIAVTVPGMYCSLTGVHLSPLVGSLLFGAGIFGAAFVLSWAAEAAQIDISQALAIAILALIAVLPEYAVDFVFTWKSAHDPEYQHYAIANMTGSNRLLVGLGWPAVLALFVLAKRKKFIVLEPSQRVEIFYLAMASVYSFTIPLKGSLTLIDTAILVLLFSLYTRRAAQLESEEPEMIGPVKIIANMSTGNRRLATILMFLFSGVVIFFAAEPFAESLIASATLLGISRFHAVQWLAPVASEAPEFIVAGTWALRGAAGPAIRTLISSKVNQWTLLVGTIPLVYAISGSSIKAFTLDELQNHELILTGAQSLMGVAILVNLRFDIVNGVLLASLFLLQFFWPDIRMEVSIVYIGLVVVFHILHRKHLLPAARLGLGLKNRGG
ncbi:MAG: sodium:calcium antiporter [Candidatus Zixiibacteriota bacterium]|nr:MAG: sodium:calcium antiporter [candidate division Zixibacteria bacterium]